MSNSALINYTILSPNYSTRTVPITKLTPHHAAMVGVDSQRIARVFTPASRGASCNYAIGVKGDITLVVPEEFCAWTSGTWGEPNHGNDGMAITFEVANDGGEPDWHVSDASIEALINLCVDICQRNNIPAINYTGDASGNLTMHSFFSATACPGPYLKSKFPYIADEINKRLGGGTYIPREKVDITYSAYTTEWLSNITNYNNIDYNGYAGWAGRPITGIRAQVSKGHIEYRAHTAKNGWLSWIRDLDGYGYAGLYGTPIDGFLMRLVDLEGYHIEYRTGILNGEWLDWIKDYGEGDNGYSGWWNKQLDRILMRVVGDPIFVPAEPKPDPVPEKPEPAPAQELYRVRKTWEDAKSQIGAYRNLDSAIGIAKSNAGYSVFDSNGNCKYDGSTIEIPKEEPKVEEKPIIPVYDLDYPLKTLIVDNTIVRNNNDCVKAIKLILSNNNNFDIEIAKAFFKLAPRYTIDPVMAISQSILETGWFKYQGSAVKPEHHNYCGLGVTSNGITGGIFNTIEDGVTALLQHLYAYGCKEELNEEILDPRFKYVTRGIAPYWQNLAGRWAVPGYNKNTYKIPEDAMNANATYGQKIKSLYELIMAIEVTDEDVNKYFLQETQPPIVEPDPIPEPKQENIWIRLLKAILKAILDVFKSEK